MKSFRKPGWSNETFATVERYYRKYDKKYWKTSSPYSRRCRLCARALKMMERLNKHAFCMESVYISTRWPDKKRGQ